MQLYSDLHGRKEPTVVPMTTHPTVLQCEDVFDHALHWLYSLSSLPAPFAVAGMTRRGPQGHPALSLKLGEKSLIIRFPVHNDRLGHASQMPSFQPQTFSFVRTVSDVLKGP